MSYGAAGLTHIIHSNGQSFTLDYNAQGRISRLTDHAGRMTDYPYDSSGKYLIRVSAPGGITTTYAYTSTATNPASQALATITYPDGTHQYYAYDERGRLGSQWRDGDAERVAYTYDALGSVFIKDAAQALTTMRLGTRGQPIAVQDPITRQLRLEYDQSYNLTRLTGPDGGISSLAYDGLGNATQIGDQLGHTTALGYTTNYNRLDWLHDAKSNPTDFAYDNAGNQEAFAWLERVYDEHDSWLHYVGLDPRLDALRAGSRFVNLLDHFRLPRNNGLSPRGAGARDR